MKPIQVFYDKRQSAKNAKAFSPSAGKPEQVVRAWAQAKLPVKVVRDFVPAGLRDLALAHDPVMVCNVLDRLDANGFGNRDREVARSLPWTTGSMVAATLAALKDGGITASPTSGFHHAGYDHGGAFCTFNGLMVAAFHAVLAGATRVGILDFDQHYGNGTDDIIHKFQANYVSHYTLGRSNVVRDNWKPLFGGWDKEELIFTPVVGLHETASQFLKRLPALMREKFAGCDVLIYQAGADSCVDDPLGGRFTVAQMRLRDRLVFQTAARMGLPVAFNLAGGYQQDFQKVLDLHVATMEEAVRVTRGAA